MKIILQRLIWKYKISGQSGCYNLIVWPRKTSQHNTTPGHHEEAAELYNIKSQ
jgi:hypothetical protein